MFCSVVVLMLRRPPRSTRTDTLFPFTTLFRSAVLHLDMRLAGAIGGDHHFGAVGGRNRSLAPGEAQRRHILGVDLHRSEEHTSELQSLMRISYAVFCLKKTTMYAQETLTFLLTQTTTLVKKYVRKKISNV